MFDLIMKGFLMISDEIVVIPLLVYGYFWVDRKRFYQGLLLLFSSMLFNKALKHFFHVPRQATSPKNTLAFPSGHTQSITVLYQWFWPLFSYHPWLLTAVSALVAGMLYALIYFQHHNLYDLVGGITAASFLVFCAQTFDRYSLRQFEITLIIFSQLSFIYLWLNGSLKSFNWTVEYAFLTLLVGHYLFTSGTLSKKSSLKATIIFTLFAAVSVGVLQETHLKEFYLYPALAFSLPLSAYLAQWSCSCLNVKRG